MNKRKELLSLFLLIVIIAVLIYFQYKEIFRIPNFYGYDTFTHELFSNYIIKEGFLPVKWPNTYNFEPVPYITIFWISFVVYHNLTLVGLHDLYKIGGLLFLVLSSFMIYLINKEDKFKAFITTVLFSFSWYIFWRGLISYPEGMAILLIFLMAYGIKRDSLPLVILSYIAYIYTHYRSAIFPTLLLGYFLFSKRKNIRYNLNVILIIFVSTILIISKIMKNLIDGLSYHFGDFSKIAQADQILERYAPLTFDKILLNVGGILLLLTSLLFINNLREMKKLSLPRLCLLLMPLTGAILMKGDLFGINIPYYRMYSYFIVSCIILISFSNLKEIINIRRLKVSLISIVIILSFITVPIIHGGFLVNNYHLEMANMLNLEKNKIVISYTPEMKVLGVSSIENDGTFINNIFSKKEWSGSDIRDIIENRYPKNMSVYIVSENSKFISDLEPTRFGNIYLFKIK
ncbi:MAG: hypothetical protein Q7S74_05735 [Nanoarchaeota archaeon]|nr:hypothetical protein [Nanoarchaeota archaeon]